MDVNHILCSNIYFGINVRPFLESRAEMLTFLNIKFVYGKLSSIHLLIHRVFKTV